MWIGNTGGCTAACSASFRLPLGWAGPYTVRRAPGSCSGPKNGMPRMWSKCRWVSSAVACIGVPERPHLPLQDVAERAQPGAEVDDERLVALDVDDEARGVAPVAPVAIPRARARPPHAVERDVHPLDVTPRPGQYVLPPWNSGPSQRTGWSSPTSTDGPDDGPLALCLHGFPDTAHTWRHLLPELAAAGYRAVAPFLRGYAPTAAARRRALPGRGAGAGRQRAARGARRRRRRRHRRARLGRPGHLRRGRAPARPLAPGRHGGRPADGVHRHVAAHLRAAPAELVHVLLPLPAGRGRRCRSTTTPSSTTSGATGRPATTGRGTWRG